MDRLWSPWRSQYVANSEAPKGCIFCAKPSAGDDAANLIVCRAEFNYVLLNLFPYTSGHLMIAPYLHVASLAALPAEHASEMMSLAQRAEQAMLRAYKPDGINLGMNLGHSAGAGVAGHIHMHMLPRWVGDANFMTTVAETRVLPEDLTESWRKLKEAFAQVG